MAFRYEDFYAGIRAGDSLFHLKLVDTADPSITFVDRGEHFHLYVEVDDVDGAARMLGTNGVPLARELHETVWGTKEFVIHDDQGHTIYFAQLPG